MYSKDIEDILAGIHPARCGSTFFRDLGDKGNFDLLLNFCLLVLFNQGIVKELSWGLQPYSREYTVESQCRKCFNSMFFNRCF